VSSGGSRPSYTFGDTPLAAERLRLVAQVFAEPSRAFLTEAVAARPRIALDLGCGPGVTTRLVAGVTGAPRTIGLDTSAAFLELAAIDGPPGVEFVLHDATELPLPEAPVDLVYCRLLLAHLPDPGATVAAWASQLAPGGRLLIDEVEWIETTHPVLAAYEDTVVGLVASRGAPMYAGPTVDGVRHGSGWQQRSSVVRIVRVATAAAARMFSMNLTTWRDDPHIRAQHSPKAIEQLAHDLDELTESSGIVDISWGIRQVAYERTGGSGIRR
jgi:trans-aconitate 2-methyltransferase